MTDGISTPALYTDFNGLAALRHKTKTAPEEALGQVAKQYEGLFLQMMLKEMRAASPDSELFDSAGLRLYQDMQDKQLALNMAERGDLGIATLIEKQLRSQALAVPAAELLKTRRQRPLPVTDHQVQLPVAGRTGYDLTAGGKSLPLPPSNPKSMTLYKEVGFKP